MEMSFASIAALLAAARSLVITGHVHPDGDCLGSVLALYHGLVATGKKVQMLIDDDIPAMYRFMPGVELIGKPADAKLVCDALVVLDASDAERIGKVGAAVEAPVINIDHHTSNVKFADYWLIDSQAAATGELILRLFREMKTEITEDIAICLYTAIATDCGFFKYANTSPSTLRDAAYLMECGAQPHLIAEQLDTRPLATLTALGKVLQTLEFHSGGQIATISVTREVGEYAQNTEGFINYPRTVEGVEVAIMFKEAEDKNVRVSLRSKNIDVSSIALSFGGGGHMRAAGCTVTGSLKDAQAKVVTAVTEALDRIPL